MAEALNYRMNLVIDPKNVIKANRELRAMERYFERIQGRVLKIGRTRMAPEIVLNDMASKGLDNLLNKINQVKSQIINASGSVDLKVKSSSNVSIDKVSSLVAALDKNTEAVKGNSRSNIFKKDEPPKEEDKKLPAWAEALQKYNEPAKVVQEVYKGVTGEDLSAQTILKIPDTISKGKEKWTATKDAWKEGGALSGLKTLFSTKKEETAEGNTEGTSGNKDLSEIKELIKKLIQVTSDRSTGGGFGGGAGQGRRNRRTGSRRSGNRGGSRRSSSGQRDFNSRAGEIARINIRDRNSIRGNRSGRQNAGGSAESNPRINPARRVPSPRNHPRNPGNRRSSKSGGILSFAGDLLTGGTDIDASSVLDMVSDSGLVEKVSKGLGVSKKFISGPLGVLADAASIATAAPGKERAQAIGSTVGGAVGSTVGGAIGTFLLPGVGTAVGSYVGGLAGDFLGGKVGGWISDHGSEIKEKASKVTGWLSEKSEAFGDSISNFFSFGKKDEPKKEPAKPPEVPKPATPPQSAVAVATKPLTPMPPFPGLPPGSQVMYGPPQPGAKGVPNPYGPMAIANQGVNPNPLLNTAAHANNGAKAKGKGKGNPTPQVVQISPEQMGTLSGFLKDFKTETTNQFNLPAGAVQVTVHENKLDVEGLITQIGYRLKAEILRATQNTKPASAGAM
ncbi:hypothetical protein GMA19_01104 [Paenibacillus polymyxa E681]|uniref:hypothetical protein n=1 Tax=Paenibacillus polymyxa TaxID=1406 RepID=UPI0001E311F2|nr:hypothetical protein [Paenibacillus polymyxa]ADM68943.1 hypothetical protein PPE_01095 [Paenibacillus polymyxa E681]QNV55951.1 hypothetical protein GE561_01104 [Paenibacillus polymyxa E681]QNV60788.1 hypothetical protein GMA19_01104 [Paenibacillus polymyxa E681]